MTEPQHTLDIGGVSRRLRYRFSDWARAERIAGIGLRSGWGVPLTTPAQMLPQLLLVGLNHGMPDLTLDKAADLVDFETEDELLAGCVKALYDYEPTAKKKLEALAEALKLNNAPSQELTTLIELIQSTSTTESGPSENTIAISTAKKSKTSRHDS